VPTGSGKTYIACALAQQACRKGHRALYRRASRLADDLPLARADGTYVRLLARPARAEVLVIDDWGYVPLKDADRRDHVELLDDRYGLRATIMTTNRLFKDWPKVFPDALNAQVIAERLTERAEHFVLDGRAFARRTPTDRRRPPREGSPDPADRRLGARPLSPRRRPQAGRRTARKPVGGSLDTGETGGTGTHRRRRRH
jgi:hypothetical protein